jgi:hypothetical protein
VSTELDQLQLHRAFADLLNTEDTQRMFKAFLETAR